MAYAIAYPFGIVGIILTMLLVRKIFSIDVDLETRNLKLSAKTSERPPDFIDPEVTNPNVVGLALRNLPFATEVGVVFSRLLRNGKVTVPDDDSVIRLGDGLRVIGPKAKLLKFEPVIGRPLVAYAAVYPLVMILRVFIVQVLILTLPPL